MYTRDHAWIEAEGSHVRVGLSDFAQGQLGDIAYIELPEPGKKLVRGEAAFIVDSLKSASEVPAPISGTVLHANPLLADEGRLRLINADPLGEGWLFVMEIAVPSELGLLLSEKEYERFVQAN